tara:strand:- start:1554 stop:1703 length:150 start_codon:yes stop_codon:yes gene_type:complete
MTISEINKLGESKARKAMAGTDLKASLKEAKLMGYDWLSMIIRQEIKIL